MTRLVSRCLLLALTIAAPLAAAIDEDDLLPVEEAFAATAQVGADGRLRVDWAIAEGYYLYRHRLGLDANADGVEVGELELPDGARHHDEFFGDVETYRTRLQASAALDWPAGVTDTPITVRFQGCADIGVCYPPHRQLLTVALPAAGPPAGGLPGDVAPITPVGLSLPGQPVASGDNPLARALSGATPAPLQDPLTPEREPPLPAEQAFVFEAIALEPTRLLARFSMPRGYYLYRDHSSFAVTGGDPVAMGAPDWPPAQAHVDDHFGEVSVYFDLVEVPLTVAPTSPDRPGSVQLTADFQGCQLDGICYPPMQRTVTVALPAATATGIAAALADIDRRPAPAAGAGADAVASTAEATGETEAERAAAALGGGGWLTLGGFFLAGLLLAFTPCVLPMVPILSGLIAGAGNIPVRRAFVLSLVYVLASALVFTGAGIVAGLAGLNLQALFQKPWILITFAALFVLMAFAMFGFYELQLPARWQTRLAQVSNRQSGGSLSGVAVMGMLSALIVGPCVAPPLAVAVTYIGQTGDPVLGGSALFAMAMGMGAPLLAVGTGAGHWLPRAGAWMDAVKALFGVAFLFLAWWMLERILPPAWTLALLGALLIGCGVYLGALQRLADHASGWRKLWQALGLVLLVLGAAQLVGAMAGGSDYLRPLAGMGGERQAAPASTEFRMVRTGTELDSALAEAAGSGRTALFDFYADWCVECKRMERYTFPEAPVQQALDQVVLLKVDVTDQTAGDIDLQRRFGIIGPPATLFFREENERRPLRLIGYEGPDDFAARIEQAKLPCDVSAC